MRVGVMNDHWPTGGGGEALALAFARAAARTDDVTLLGPAGGFDRNVLAERFGDDLSDLPYEALDAVPEGAFDLFVNMSFASGQPNLGARGILVCQFPMPLPLPDSALARLDARLRGDRDFAAVFGRGFQPLERLRWHATRWTDGEGELTIRRTPDGPRSVRLGLARLLPWPRGVDYLIEVDGREVAGGTLARPRRHLDAVLPHTVDVVLPPQSPRNVTLRLRSDTVVPHDLVHNGDHRTLGLPVASISHTTSTDHAMALLGRGVQRPPPFVDTYDEVVAISEFTRRWIRRRWRVDSSVVHPPVAPQTPGTKRRMILAVGRFITPGRGHAKKQLELVHAFGQLQLRGLDGWELHLVGGCRDVDVAYLEHVQRAAARLPVHVHVDAPAAELRRLYREAAISWHATGLGEDPETHPERLEHFGIATVEAMSAGAVPLVYAGGGSTETVVHGRSGYHFHSIAELVELTEMLVADPERRDHLAHQARARAAQFGAEQFEDATARLLDRHRSSPPASR